MKRTYTQGPWNYDKDLGIVYVKDIKTKENYVAHVTEHNGHLIAASPDMLEALEYALECLEASSHANKTLAIALVKQAIAKAKGMSQFGYTK